MEELKDPDLIDDLILLHALRKESDRVWSRIVKHIGFESTSDSKDAKKVFDILACLSIEKGRDISLMDYYRVLTDIKERNNATTNS